MADIEAKVKEIIMNKLGVEAAQVTPEASFTNDLGADSLDTTKNDQLQHALTKS